MRNGCFVGRSRRANADGCAMGTLDLGSNGKFDGDVVIDPLVYPLKSICRLSNKRQGVIGTGVLITPHHILTAGHLAAQADEWEVKQCYHFKDNFPERKGQTHKVHPKYQDTSGLDFDIGIIRTSNSLRFPLTPTRWKAVFKDLPVYVCGYSAQHESHMRFHAGQILHTDKSLASHNCDTYRGQSGSPVIFGGDYPNKFLGIHVGGDEYAPDRFRSVSNKCILFTDKIKRWIDSQSA